MTAWLHIVGVGEAGLAELPQSVRPLLVYADTIIGPAHLLEQIEPADRPAAAADLFDAEQVSRRSFEAVARALSGEQPAFTLHAPPDDTRKLIEWEGPLPAMLEQVLALRGTPTVILASGDPMWFGIGATLSRHLVAAEFAVYPHPSAFQLAAARMRWPLQAVTLLSLQGRPVEALHPHILPANRIMALAAEHSVVDLALEILIDRGYSRSIVTTLEHLGGRDEQVTTATAEDFHSSDLGDAYVLAIDCVPDLDARLLAAVPGLPDDVFVHDGQLAPREVRTATLGKLAPFPGAILWDVGAGCGAIAIEWLRAARDARATAFENEGEQLNMIALNATALGVPDLEIVGGPVPQSFGKRTPPDAIFMGGDVGNDDLFDACWHALKPGGRLVANATTLDGEHALYSRHLQLGGQLTRIEVSALEQIGGHRAFRPSMAVTQWVVVKAIHGAVVAP
jgi:precorrin-6Y C5,15-methyltransferase (decarboxylating)